jgi:hypothetical protein
MRSMIFPWRKKQNQTTRLFQGMGPTELPRVEEGKAPDSSLSVAWMAKPGPVASKTQVWLHDVESTCVQLVPAVGRRLQA